MNDRPILDDQDREERRLEIEAEIAAERDEQKNHNFLQITKPNMRDLRLLARASLPAYELISIMAEKMNRQNAIIVSQQTLATITGYSLITIKRAIAYLEKTHWLQIVKIGTANAYAINSAVFWTSTRKGRFATFHAQVISSEAEQRKPMDNSLKLKPFPVLYSKQHVTLTGDETEQKELEI